MRNFFFLLIAIILINCSGASQKNSKPIVVTTTGMIYDAVKVISQDSVTAIPLMGPGVDPHLYKATQGDLSKLNKADLILYNGHHLEGKMGEVFENLGRVKKVVAVAETIPEAKLRQSENFQGNVDPHVWFDVSLWKYVVQEVGKQLIALDSENAQMYERNTSTYLSKLDSLHDQVKIQLSEIPEQQRILITSHDAFGYFGDAYDIKVHALQGISTVTDFGLKDIANLIDIITQNQVKAVFVETSVSEKAIKAVVDGCKQKGAEVTIGGSLFSDAMGDFKTFQGTYLGMVDSNVKTIVNALKPTTNDTASR